MVENPLFALCDEDLSGKGLNSVDGKQQRWVG